MTESLANGRYQVLRKLAAGGMGEVLLAEFGGDAEISPGLLVVKRILGAVAGQSPPEGQVKMLHEEARLGLRLRHGNLVETFRFEGGNDPLLIMELLAGRSMAQVLGQAKKQKEAVPIDVALAILRGSCCGLHFAHTLKSTDGGGLGLVHRDVSPANIFVTFDNGVKVIDFGVAKSEDSEIKTAFGVLKGKLGYMSPEQTHGSTALTAQADVWSLGVFFWEMLVAERLFASPNPSATFMQISQKVLQSPCTFRPDIPPGVEAICMGMLERNTDNRFASCADVARAIDALPGGGGGDRVSVGAFLAERFPEEASSGATEAARCAKTLSKTPVPQGLVDAADDYGDYGDYSEEPATTVISADVRLALIKAASLADGGPVAVDTDAATIRVSADVLAQVRMGIAPPMATPSAISDADAEDLIPTHAMVPVAGSLSRPGTEPSGAVRSRPMAGPGVLPLDPPLKAPTHTPFERFPRVPTKAPMQGLVPPPVQAPVPPPVQAPVSPPVQAAVQAAVQAPVHAPVHAPVGMVPNSLEPVLGAAWTPEARLPTANAAQLPSTKSAARLRPTGATAAPVVVRSTPPTTMTTMALATFGALIFMMGVGFSFAITRGAPKQVYAYSTSDGADVIVADLVDVPAGSTSRAIDVKNAQTLKTSAGDAKLVAPDQLQRRLMQSGIWTRASLPSTTRTQFSALLPVLIAAMGLLALAFALPAFLVSSKRVRLGVQVALLLAASCLTGLAVEYGVLSWPGRAAWRGEAPHLQWQ